jgi:DNA-directed RNA polymerase subunit RPC12/RpoP
MKRKCIFCEKEFEGDDPQRYGICPECRKDILKDIIKK